MKNFKLFNAEKYSNSNEYEKVEEGIYKKSKAVQVMSCTAFYLYLSYLHCSQTCLPSSVMDCSGQWLMQR